MIEVQTVGKVDVDITVPGSKSLTQRALIAAALANGESVLNGPLVSEDTEYSSTALRQVGVEINHGAKWRIVGNSGKIGPSTDPVFLGNNGTATRFLTSVLSLGTSPFTIDGDKRMYERPIDPLMAALKGWGVDLKSIHGTGCPPLAINSAGIAGGSTVLPEGKSSQYLSSLLLVAPYAREIAELRVEGEVLSKPYVNMTLAVLSASKPFPQKISTLPLPLMAAPVS